MFSHHMEVDSLFISFSCIFLFHIFDERFEEEIKDELLHLYLYIAFFIASTTK